MKVTLVRHGETDANYDNKLQGRSNNLLNDTGRRQCQRLREKLKNEHFDVCYTSPLVRCVETAMILIGDRVEMIPDKRLIERGLGNLEGECRSKYNVKKYWDYDLNSTDEGVEGVQNIFERCNQFLDYILEKHQGKSILIVSHSTPVRAIHHILKKTELNSDLVNFKIDNCYLEEIEVKK